jgi:hypothetical protein
MFYRHSRQNWFREDTVSEYIVSKKREDTVSEYIGQI